MGLCKRGFSPMERPWDYRFDNPSSFPGFCFSSLVPENSPQTELGRVEDHRVRVGIEGISRLPSRHKKGS